MNDSSSKHNMAYARQVEQTIKNTRDLFFNNKKGSEPDDLYRYDYTPYCVKRRIRAIINCTSKILKIFSDYESKESIQDSFIFSNTLIMGGGYNCIDNAYEITLAAAIWILDQLRLQGNLSEIYQFLPDMELPYESEESVKFPYVSHSSYDSDLIYATANLLLFRNANDYKKELLNNGSLTGYVSSGMKHTPRANYEAVMSLLDKNKIKEVVDAYEEKCWEFYQLTFEAKMLIDKKEQEILKKLSATNTDAVFTKSSGASPIMQPKPPSALLIDPVSSFQFKGSGAQYSEKKKLEAELKFLQDFTLTSFSLPYSRENTANDYKKVLPAKLLNDIVMFSVEDPFDMSFALLYMLDTDSDIPWLYYGSLSVAYTVQDQLPFNTSIEMPGDVEYQSVLNSDIYQYKYKGCRWNDMTDCNGKPATRTFGKNLGQILYRYGYSLYPRTVYAIPDLDNFFEELGVTDDDEKSLYSLLLHLMISTNFTEESLMNYRLRTATEEQIEDLSKVDSDNQFSEKEQCDILQQQNRELRKKNHMLQNALSEEFHLKKNTEQQLILVQKEREKLSRELSDLRSLVFNINNNAEEPDVDSFIKFPQTINSKIISFGGHPSWISEMKKLLPDLIYCSPETIPNIDLLKCADEVWIQTNCISHAAYYRIVNNISNSNTQLHYFEYSGSRKCAEQLIKTER